jgi:hypothetical protein
MSNDIADAYFTEPNAGRVYDVLVGGRDKSTQTGRWLRSWPASTRAPRTWPGGIAASSTGLSRGRQGRA